MEELVEHLAKEMTLYRDLISILQRETRALVERDYEGLYEIVTSKEHILMKLAFLDGRRSEIIRRIGKSLGFGDREVRLSDIISKAEPPHRERLKEHQTTILAFLNSIKEINDINNFVARGSLENIKKALGFLGNFISSGTYKSTGTVEEMVVKGSRLCEGV